MKNTILKKLQLLENEGRLPHALLLVATNAAVAREVALQFAKWLLCQCKAVVVPEDDIEGEELSLPCSVCNSCTLFAADTHLDFLAVVPQASGSTFAIKVDQIREVTAYLQQRPQLVNNKIVFVEELQYLNENAANSFLKTLEEPPASAILIMTTTNANLLLPTITSRCVQFDLDADGSETYVDDITHISNYNELSEQIEQGLFELLVEKKAVIAGKSSALALAEKWSKHKPIDVLDCLWIILNRLIKQQYVAADLSATNSVAAKEQRDRVGSQRVYLLRQSLSKQQLSNLWPILNKIAEAKALLCNGKHLNLQLFLENMLIEWK